MTAEPFPCIDARAAWRGDPAECRKLYRIFAQQGFAATRRAYGWTRAAMLRAYGWTRAAMLRALRVGKAFRET